jgi:hypothetical protein
MGVMTMTQKKATKLRLFVIFLTVFLTLSSACAQPAAQRPVDPGNVGLLAFCGYEDALANSKADWAVMASAESEFEVSLAAVDRLERSYFAASSALAKVTPDSDLYPSAQYVTSALIRLTLIFRDFKRAIIYQDNAALQEAQGDYATTYNTLKSELETGALPGAAAFSEMFGAGSASCAGIVTNVFPASSGYSDAEPINRIVCSNGSGQYSVADLFSELGAVELDSNDAAPFIAAYVEIGFRMQPLLELSSGPLLNGLASILSGIMTLDYLFDLDSTSAEIYDETFLLIVDGLEQTRSSCGDLGIDV